MRWFERVWRRNTPTKHDARRYSTSSNRDVSKMNISAPVETWKTRGDHSQDSSNHGNRSSVRIVDDEGDGLTSTAGFEPVCQVMSDLHLEWRGYEQFEITREAPTLLLVGDIGRFCDSDRFLDFLRRQCDLFDRVLLVPGNHEFYGSSRQAGLDLGAKLELELGERFTFMHRNKVELNNGKVVVLGCTLHSHIPDDYTALTNDFARIRDWRVKDHNQEHAVDLEWLQKSLTEVETSTPQTRVIVATHYAPASERTEHPKREHNKFSHCFCSDALGKLRGCRGMNQVSHWVFGHTHYNTLFKYDDITVVSNQPSGPTSDEYSGRPFNPRFVI